MAVPMSNYNYTTIVLDYAQKQLDKLYESPTEQGAVGEIVKKTTQSVSPHLAALQKSLAELDNLQSLPPLPDGADQITPNKIIAHPQHRYIVLMEQVEQQLEKLQTCAFSSAFSSAFCAGTGSRGAINTTKVFQVDSQIVEIYLKALQQLSNLDALTPTTGIMGKIVNAIKQKLQNAVSIKILKAQQEAQNLQATDGSIEVGGMISTISKTNADQTSNQLLLALNKLEQIGSLEVEGR